MKILAMMQTRFMTLGKLLYFSEYQVPYLWNRDTINIARLLQGYKLSIQIPKRALFIWQALHKWIISLFFRKINRRWEN